MASTPKTNVSLSPELQAALREDVQKLAEEPAGLKKLLDSLKDETADLKGIFEDSTRRYMDALSTPAEKAAFLRSVKAEIVILMRGTKDAFEQKKEEQDNKVDELERKHEEKKSRVAAGIMGNKALVESIRDDIKSKSPSLTAFEIEDKVREAIDAEAEKRCPPGPELEKARDKAKRIKKLIKVLGGKTPEYIREELRRQEDEKARAGKRARGAEEAKEMEVKDVGDYSSVDDITQAEAKWGAVVTELKRKPGKREDGETLYWTSPKSDGIEEITDPETVAMYWRFREYIGGRQELEDEIRDKAMKVAIDMKGKTPEALEEEAGDRGKELLDGALADKGEAEVLLLYHALGVKNKPQAYEKLKNIIYLRIIPVSRKDKNIYEEEKDDEGKVKTVPLKDFLAKHDPFGEKMVSHSQELLVKLHKQYGSGMAMPEFRDVLIAVIKSKGGKAAGKLDPAKASEIYTTFLVAKDPNMGEKELCALLIALKEHPPYVFDLLNTTEGWRINSGKKTNKILEDFCLDGAIYNELKGRLGLKGTAFNTFIMKIAPYYERIRSFIRGMEDRNEKVDLEEMNRLFEDLKMTESDLANFRKLMTVPLWPDKVGHAYKHAYYIDGEGKREIPLMEKIQGPDKVKELNVVFVNVEEKIRRIAERLADERLDQELKEIGPQGWRQFYRVWRIGAKWWKRNAAEGYRERYRNEYVQRLKTDPRFRTELMALPRGEVKPGWALGAKMGGRTPAEGTRADINTEMDAIAERFGISWTSGDTQSYLMEGEERDSMINNLNSIAIQTAIRDLCRLYADGTVNDAEFQNRVRTQIIPQIQALQDPPDASVISFLEETTGRGAVDINKMGLLDRLRAHRAGLINLEIDTMRINIKVGRAQNVDVKTQVKSLNWTDRMSRGLVERLQRNRFLGRFINPTTTAIMGYGLGNITTQAFAGRLGRYGTLATVGLLAPTIWPAVAGIAAGCLVGGAFSAMRQNKETLRLKAMKERRGALGRAPADDTKGLGPLWGPRFERRLEINGGLYNQVPAEVLRNNINGSADYVTLQNNLAAAIALNEISEMGVAPGETEKLDLISYSGEMSIEAGRLQLLRSISEGRLRMRTMAGGRDSNADLALAVANARTNIVNQVRTSDRTFQRFKRRENLRAAGVGAVIGAGISSLGMLIPHETVTTHANDLTPGGTVDRHNLDIAISGAGLTPAQVADIDSHLAFDPATNRLTQASINYIRNTYHITVDGILTPGSWQHLVTPLHGGTPMSQADVMSELSANGVNTAPVKFDAAGHLDPGSDAYLQGLPNKVTLQEIVTPAPHGTGTPPSGWTRIASIHFNDNQPHAPNAHILDELRVNILGKMQPAADGNYHFTAAKMFDPSLRHSMLPSGVNMPPDASGLKVGLQMHYGGKVHWKFFTPDSSGEFKIPKEYIDQSTFGPIPRGGSTLPGLRTEAIAVGFDDSHGTFQVLASAKGVGGYTPGENVEFTGDIASDNFTEGSEAYTAMQEVVEREAYTAAIPPLVGYRMQHLEYGEDRKRDERMPPKQKGKRPGRKPEEKPQPAHEPGPGTVPEPGPGTVPVPPGKKPEPVPGTAPEPSPSPKRKRTRSKKEKDAGVNVNINQTNVAVVNQIINIFNIYNIAQNTENIKVVQQYTGGETKPSKIKSRIALVGKFLEQLRGSSLDALSAPDASLSRTIDDIPETEKGALTVAGINLIARIFVGLKASLSRLEEPFRDTRALLEICFKLLGVPEDERRKYFLLPPAQKSGPSGAPPEADRSPAGQPEKDKTPPEKPAGAEMTPRKLLKKHKLVFEDVPKERISERPELQVLKAYTREDDVEKDVFMDRLNLADEFLTFMEGTEENLRKITADDPSLEETLDKVPPEIKDKLNKEGLNLMARFYQADREKIEGKKAFGNAFDEIARLTDLALKLRGTPRSRLFRT